MLKRMSCESATGLTLSYVMPAHNEAEIVAESIRLVRAWLEPFGGSEIVVVENGSRDATLAIAEREAATPGLPVRVFTSAKGLGAALKVGIAEARGDVVITTAADLPFGRSDLDAYIAAGCPEFAVGSKAHRHSEVPQSPLRACMTLGFRVLRFAVLRVRTGDTQGTQLMHRPLAASLSAKAAEPGFGFSTEMVFLASRAGIEVVELPVAVSQLLIRPSTVRPLRDSLRMVRSTRDIRRRHRHHAPPIVISPVVVGTSSVASDA